MSGKNYTDLIKAHKLYIKGEGWFLYDEYMKSKDADTWFKSEEIPMKEVLILFGFIFSWQARFEGAPEVFLQRYKDVFKNLKAFRESKLIEIGLTKTIQPCIANIFDEIAQCTRPGKNGKRRYESTAASKILHMLIPELFVMWDSNIRKGILDEKDEKKDGKVYAYEFLPKMQEELRAMVGYGKGNYQTVIDEIAKETNGYTLAKVLDEFNYVQYTLKKSLEEIRNYCF